MDIYPKYKSLLGYKIDDEDIDSYGVNHSGFSTQDELAYQMARDKREKQLIENYNQQGITENYPQYATNFWGDAENNYGFGSSDIAEAISTHPAMNTTPVPIMQSPTTIDSNNSFSDSYGGVSDYGSVLDGLNENTNKTSITSTLQSQTPTPWNPTVVSTSTTSTPWRNNQTLTPWNGGYDLSAPNTQSNVNEPKVIDYSLYGDDFSHDFIDKMLADSDYQRALNEYVIPNEKGYIYNKRDPGGETNMGIAKRYHPNEDIKNLTRERANAILYNDIWNWNGINKLPREIRGFVFDHGVRTSPQNAIETTHQALGINPVGDIIGNTTLNLLQNTDYEEFLQRYQNLVKQQDRNNKRYQYFGKGWDNRTNGYHVSY